MPAGIRKATYADVDALVRSLTCALDDDPFVNWIVRQDGKRSQGLDLLFRTCLWACLPYGQVLTTEDCVGAALWYPPGAGQIGVGRQVAHLSMMIRIAGLGGLGRLLHVIGVLNRAHREERHHYLQFLGVAPPRQHEGLGTALMLPVLEQCDHEACGAYLENSKEANIPYYERFGFRVAGEIRLGQGSPPLWPMWRPARSTSR